MSNKMDSLFYIVVILLVILKMLIWVCVFYSRAQRVRMARCQRGIIIIQDGRRGILIPAESDTAIQQAGVENPHITAMMPPSYEEVLRTKSSEAKPPPYDQVQQCADMFQLPMPIGQLPDAGELPPSYTQNAHDEVTVPQQEQQQQQHQQENNSTAQNTSVSLPMSAD